VACMGLASAGPGAPDLGVALIVTAGAPTPMIGMTIEEDLAAAMTWTPGSSTSVEICYAEQLGKT
jgi:hypothetical protein